MFLDLREEFRKRRIERIGELVKKDKEALLNSLVHQRAVKGEKKEVLRWLDNKIRELDWQIEAFEAFPKKRGILRRSFGFLLGKVKLFIVPLITLFLLIRILGKPTLVAMSLGISAWFYKVMFGHPPSKELAVDLALFDFYLMELLFTYVVSWILTSVLNGASSAFLKALRAFAVIFFLLVLIVYGIALGF
jgi:hypothetical protein